ncbi:MAG: HU family DNA-binding protein [Ktedonobacteraceae bacterium]
MPTPNSKTPKIVGKDELSHLVAAKAHVEVKEADAMLDALMETIQEQVAKGRQVRLIGFGSWRLRAVSARTIKSIRGGTPIHIPAGKRVSFSAGSLLAKAAKAPTPMKKAVPAKVAAPVKKTSGDQQLLKKTTK